MEELDDAFDSIAAAMKRAAAETNYVVASNEATQLGLVKQGDDTPSQKHFWERTEGDKTSDSNGVGMINPMRIEFTLTRMSYPGSLVRQARFFGGPKNAMRI